MKRRPITELSSRTIRAYVKEKLRGFSDRQREREQVRGGKKRPAADQGKLFE